MIHNTPMNNFSSEIFYSMQINNHTQKSISPVLIKQMKLFDFSNNPLLINHFSAIDFIDHDICNEYLFIIFDYVKQNKHKISSFNYKKVKQLVKNRNINKSFNIQHILTDDFHLLTPFIKIIYTEDNSIFSGDINNKENYEILIHFLSDYIFRNPPLNIRDDILIKAWFIHILYSMHNQNPDKTKHHDLFFLTKLFFEQSFFFTYNDSYNMELLDNNSFFFLNDKQKRLSLSEYLILAKEEMYYDYGLNKENIAISENLASYFLLIRHSVNNPALHSIIEKYILFSKIYSPEKIVTHKLKNRI